VNQCRRKLDTLLISVRQGLDRVHSPISQSKSVKPIVGGVESLVLIHPVQTTEIGELVVGFHLWVEATLLGHIAKSQPVVWPYGLPVPTDGAGVESDEPEDSSHRRRLAGAVGSEESEHSSPGNIEPATIERNNVAEGLVEVTDREHGTGEAT